MSSGQKQSYALYLQSAHWKGLRVQALRFAKRRCESCGSRRQLECHHLIYRIPLTTCTTGDLMVLCNRCHGFTHGIPDLRRLMDACADLVERRTLVLDICAGRFRAVGRKTIERQIQRAVAGPNSRIRRFERQNQPLRPQTPAKRWVDYGQFLTAQRSN